MSEAADRGHDALPRTVGVLRTWVGLHLALMPVVWAVFAGREFVSSEAASDFDLRALFLPLITAAATGLWWGVVRVLTRWGAGVRAKARAVFAGYVAWSVGLAFAAGANVVGPGITDAPLTFDQLGRVFTDPWYASFATVSLAGALANGVVALWLCAVVDVRTGAGR